MPSSILHPPSSLRLNIANRQRTRKVNLRQLNRITGHLLSELKIEGAELGINLVAEREMALVNETFLRHAGSTDVITFDYTETRNILHGELFICVDEAILQAKTFKTDWRSEVVRYIVHGVLHLLGHDDSHPVARRKMKREENRLLRLLSRRFSLAELARANTLSA